jgi:1-deoxy-D-xylulose-5-phosphate synthase
MKPLDADTIVSAARRCGRMVTVEENVRQGGFGQAVRDVLHEHDLGAVPHRILALPDAFIHHGPQPVLRSECGLDAKSVVAAAMQTLGQESTLL